MTVAVGPVVGIIRERTPRALCQFCGDDEVAALCCNCEAFLCGKHQRQADLDEARRQARSLLRLGVHRAAAPDVIDRVPPPDKQSEKPDKPPDDSDGNKDGDNNKAGDRDNKDGDSGLRRPTEANRAPAEPKSARRRYFCPECVPVGHRYDLQVYGALACVVVGLALALFGSVVGAVVLVVAASWLIARVATGLVRLRRRGRMNRGLLFLTPNIRKVELTETVTGRCVLDIARRERLEVDDVEGVIEVGLRWTGNHAADVERHRRRSRSSHQHALRVEAGHLVLRGVGQLDLKHPASCEVTHPARVSFRPYVADQEILSHPEGHGDARWDFALSYRPREPEVGRRLPVWVTPSFTPNSGRRALDLRVQWRTVEPIASPDDGPELAAKEVTSIVLDVPAAWGPIRETTLEDVEQVLVGRAPDGSTRIEWRKPAIGKDPRGACDLSVSFARPVDPSATVKGEVEIVFAQAISGITAVQMHAPGGGRHRDGARPKISTKVKVRFELSLSGIHHQESRTVPDAAIDLDKTESRPFDDTRPDEHLVAGLVQQLAQQSYLVKSVVEHPARPGRGVGLQRRVWDVSGRRYRGVHPIDFRITVTGDEAEPGGESSSSTAIRLIVRGVHTSDAMAKEIVTAYDEIWARIHTTVKAARTGADGNYPRRQAEPLAAMGTRAAQLWQTLLSIERLVDEAERSGGISTDVAEQLHNIIEIKRDVDP